MGYQIFSGHQLESLVETHLARFRAPFFGNRPTVVIQSQSLAQWLKLFLARKLGGYATGDFVFQDEALRRLLHSHQGPRPLFLDDLKYALYRRLSRVLTGPVDPVYAPLLGTGGVPDPQRLFELADHIAGVFHNYAMNSDLWPSALTKGQLPPEVDAEAAFSWQSRLWRDLLTGDEGTLAGLVMDELTRNPPSSPAQSSRPQLLIVGSTFLSRRAARFLHAWAEAGMIEVVHLLLLPAPLAAFRPGYDRRPWSSWGTFGRAFLRNLPDHEEDSAPRPARTALETLQAALSRGLPFEGVPDGSLEVVSSPHPLRELEALRDRLLDALAADPTLEVNEIAVLAPDINVYAPFFDAVFSSDDEGRGLRFHVIDLDLGRENAWFRALDALLSLVSGTMDRPTLFALVDTPAFQEAWNLDAEDRDLWLDYTEAVSAWREEGPAGPQSWTRSWERLFSGWFLPADSCVATPPPLATSPSAFRSLGKFFALVDDLGARARDTGRPRSFVEWVRFLEHTMAAFLSPGEGTGATLAGRLRTLALDAGPPPEPLPWSGFRAFLQDQVAHFPGRRGQLLTEGIHCSSLRPLRAIPFRVVAVLGLDEGRFPRQTPAPSFDLRRFEPGQDELSSLSLDRYTFWETIMAARSVLYLSYQGRSAIDGSERPPSPLLADLLDYLEESGAPWPVRQTTVKDFSVAGGTAVTWSPRTQRRAWAVAHPERSASPVLPPPPSIDEAFPEVRTADVVLAFSAPARFHLARIRQVVLRQEDRRSVDDEEPWSLDFLDQQAWLQECLRRQLAGGAPSWDVDAWMEQLIATGRVRPGVFADQVRQGLGDQASRVRAWARDLEEQGWKPDAPTASPRTRWSGRPWAVEPKDRFRRGAEALVPRLLYTKEPQLRNLVEAAVAQLLDPVPELQLALLGTEGAPKLLQWSLDDRATTDLAARAEAYWAVSAARPLPFYADYLGALQKRRADNSEPWARTVEEAWTKVRTAPGTRSEKTLAHCPYAALAFPDEPEWADLVGDLELWWDDLFVPLLGAWK